VNEGIFDTGWPSGAGKETKKGRAGRKKQDIDG
jgi:hypothetical protein